MLFNKFFTFLWKTFIIVRFKKQKTSDCWYNRSSNSKWLWDTRMHLRHYTRGHTQFTRVLSSHTHIAEEAMTQLAFRNFCKKEVSILWLEWESKLFHFQFLKEKKYRLSFRCICFWYNYYLFFCIGIIIGKINFCFYKQDDLVSQGSYD